MSPKTLESATMEVFRRRFLRKGPMMPPPYLDAKTLILRAEALYLVLPDAGFDDDTFMELGRAANAERPWAALSKPLKLVLLRLVSDYAQAVEGDDEADEVKAEVEAAAEAIEGVITPDEIVGPKGSEVEADAATEANAATEAEIVEAEAAP